MTDDHVGILTLIIWILGGFATSIAGGTLAYVSIVQRISRLETSFDFFKDALGRKSARILHSPHTPELDALLEKWYDPNYEMQISELKNLNQLLHDIENNIGSQRTKEERSLAAILEIIVNEKIKQMTQATLKRSSGGGMTAALHFISATVAIFKGGFHK